MGYKSLFPNQLRRFGRFETKPWLYHNNHTLQLYSSQQVTANQLQSRCTIFPEALLNSCRWDLKVPNSSKCTQGLTTTTDNCDQQICPHRNGCTRDDGDEGQTSLGGGFRYLLLSPRALWKMNPIWRTYFSNLDWFNHQLLVDLNVDGFLYLIRRIPLAMAQDDEGFSQNRIKSLDYWNTWEIVPNVRSIFKTLKFQPRI